MIEIKAIKEVQLICEAANYIAYSNSSEIVLIPNFGEEYIIQESAFRLYAINDNLVFQNKEGTPVKVFVDKKVNYLKDCECYMSTKNRNALIISQKCNDEYIDYLLQPNLKLIKIPFFPNYVDTNYIVYYWSKVNINLFNLHNESSWQLNIREYSSNNSTAFNEIDGDIFVSDNLLFIPLKNCQLLALTTETGKKAWMLEQEIGGQYTIWNDRIYKKNRIIYEIDANTGNVLRQFDIESQLPGFMPVGPIWSYEDVLIIVNILEGDIAIIDRHSFNVLERITTNSRLANHKDILIRHHQKLYILDLNNTLHIFEAE